MPKVYNRHHETAPKGAVFVGRGSPWGNPFIIGIDGNRRECIRKFANMLLGNKTMIKKVREELRGKDLICYCSPKGCHATILLQVANAPEKR